MNNPKINSAKELNMFLAHTSDIKLNSIKSLDFLENKKILVNNNGKYTLTNNVCPHQNSRIVLGEKTELKCQYHGWTWDLEGNPTGSGITKICNNSKLTTKPVYESNGLLFDKDINLDFLNIDFSSLRLQEYRVDKVYADPKICMDIFLDVDHIPIVHNKVYNLLGIENEANVEWSYHSWGSTQKVTDENNNLIAVWIAVYPYTMIEWQAGSVFISQCFTDNNISVWKYIDVNDSLLNYEINSNMWETAFNQDKTQAEQIIKLPSSNLEDAKMHYRKWLQENEFLT